MGQGESQPEPPERSVSTGGGAAFHVLRVAEQSPAAEAGIDPFFDFICGVNGRPLGDEIDALTHVLEESEGTKIVLQVWSTKRKELRDVDVVPSRHWSSTGAPPAPGSQPSLLGLSLRVCHPHAALDQVWHVLEILEGSPAQSAGLVPFGDWIVGYAGGVLRGEGDFYDVVEAHVDKPLRLFVYNADYDVTREAILVPNRSWGGEGLLGCGVGYGLLHRIPRPQDRRLPLSLGSENGDEHEYQNDDYDDGGGAEHVSRSRAYVDRDGEPGDGYEEAGYGYDATEGVEVVPVEGDEEGGFDTFVPADAYATAAREPMQIPRGSFNEKPYTPRRASSAFGVEDVITEEEEMI